MHHAQSTAQRSLVDGVDVYQGLHGKLSRVHKIQFLGYFIWDVYMESFMIQFYVFPCFCNFWVKCMHCVRTDPPVCLFLCILVEHYTLVSLGEVTPPHQHNM